MMRLVDEIGKRCWGSILPILIVFVLFLASVIRPYFLLIERFGVIHLLIFFTPIDAWHQTLTGEWDGRSYEVTIHFDGMERLDVIRYALEAVHAIYPLVPLFKLASNPL